MTEKYCASCAVKLIPTMRICPSCGSRQFSPTPPVIAASTPVAPTPATALQKPTPQTKFAPAGHWQRFLAFVMDSFIVLFLAGIPLALSYLFSLPKKEEMGINIISVLLVLGSMVVPYLYYTVMHGSPRRATYGKSALGLILVTVQGEQLSKTQAFVRVVLTALVPVCGLLLLGLSAAGIAMQYKEELQASLVVAVTLGVGAVYLGPFLTMFFNARHQTLFDLICKTCVIKNSKP